LFMNTIVESYISYRALIIPAGAWCVAQVLKLFIELIRDKHLDFSNLITMGGMPSAHSATVTSLATTIAIIDGFDSLLFALSVFFAIIVMYDAAGVRQTVGNQSNILNKILDELFKGKPAFEQRFKELIGHSRLQVLAGALLGILLGWWWA
jgi:acid phosphatase family membrane protein YuiD